MKPQLYAELLGGPLHGRLYPVAGYKPVLEFLEDRVSMSMTMTIAEAFDVDADVLGLPFRHRYDLSAAEYDFATRNGWPARYRYHDL